MGEERKETSTVLAEEDLQKEKKGKVHQRREIQTASMDAQLMQGQEE